MDHVEYLEDDIVHGENMAPGTNALSFARYTAWVAALVGGGSILVMLFVALVDPYQLFRLVEIEGVNRVKPLPGQYREQIKLAQAVAQRPNAVLFGNSRIEVGFDPASPSLVAHGYSSYNLALSGTTLAVAQDLFAHLRANTAPPKLAVIGVEFLDFLVDPVARPAPANHLDNRTDAHQWRIDTLFSMKSLSDAWTTLRLQKTPDPETMTSRGQTPLHEYRRYARQEGYHMIFQQRAQENAKNILRKQPNLYGADGVSASIDSLRRMLAVMAADRTEVHLVIYPYHAQLMAMFDEAGLGSTMDEWKNLLVREVAAVNKQYPAAHIKLWDFSGFDAVQCEPIPAPGDTNSTTRFYWEAGHFKSSVGELILQRIAGREAPIGTVLTSANLDQNRQRILDERVRCEGAQPEVFKNAGALVRNARAHLPTP